MRTLLITVLLVFAGFPLLSQQEGVPSSESKLAMYEDLFSLEEPLNLTLKFDVKAIKKARDQEVYHDAEMTNLLGDDSQAIEPLQVMARGTMRRKYCALPPLWLSIPYAEIKTDAPQDAVRMKLELRCKSASHFEPYVLREYLVYKIYNMITPLSYRVRLVRLTIIDTGKDNEMIEEWAFLHEPDELMTLRLNSLMIKSDRLSMRTVNPEIMNSLSMFQYMIGNTDYSVTGSHKLNILTSKEYGPTGFLPVPYDFDYSGLVNADYALPSEELGTSSVRERFYLGPCRPNQVHKETIQELAKYEDKIMEYIKGFEYLDEKERTDMIGYLESFFKESSESGFIARRITPTCR